jgi:hypothetical protein
MRAKGKPSRYHLTSPHSCGALTTDQHQGYAVTGLPVPFYSNLKGIFLRQMNQATFSGICRGRLPAKNLPFSDSPSTTYSSWSRSSDKFDRLYTQFKPASINLTEITYLYLPPFPLEIGGFELELMTNGLDFWVSFVLSYSTLRRCNWTILLLLSLVCWGRRKAFYFQEKQNAT